METYCLKWNSFQTNISNTISDFRREEDFFDVTLVTDDQQFIPAHKLVLSSSSDIFKNILRKSSHPYPHPNPLIYLNGFSSKQLNLIMDYIYLGEVRIFPQDIDSFISDAQKLKIEGLILAEGQSSEEERRKVKNEGFKREDTSFVERKQEEEFYGGSISDDKKTNMDGKQLDSTTTNFEKTSSEETQEMMVHERDIKDQSLPINNINLKKKRKSGKPKSMNVSTALVNHSSSFEDVKQLVENLLELDGDLLRCKTCGKTARNRGNMERHVEIHIEGLSFDCQFCDKTYKTRMSRDQHKKLKHPKSDEAEEVAAMTLEENTDSGSESSSVGNVTESLYLYCCPLESCTFATDKAGMKGGVAAEHLKLDHSISGDMIKKAEKGSYKFKKVKEEN